MVDTFALPDEEWAAGSELDDTLKQINAVSPEAAAAVKEATRTDLEAAGDATFFSQREESGSTFVIAYFVDRRHGTLVLTDVDVFR